MIGSPRNVVSPTSCLRPGLQTATSPGDLRPPARQGEVWRRVKFGAGVKWRASVASHIDPASGKKCWAMIRFYLTTAHQVAVRGGSRSGKDVYADRKIERIIEAGSPVFQQPAKAGQVENLSLRTIGALPAERTVGTQ